MVQVVVIHTTSISGGKSLVSTYSNPTKNVRENCTGKMSRLHHGSKIDEDDVYIGVARIERVIKERGRGACVP
jgi:hypothetical protein